MKSNASCNVRNTVIKAVKICLLIAVMLSCLFVTAYALDEEFYICEGQPEELLQMGGFPEMPVPNSEAALFAASDGFEEFVLQALLQRAERIDVSAFEIPSTEDIASYYWGVLNNHPELFFVTNKLSYSARPFGHFISITPTYLESVSEEDVREFNQRVDIILSETLRHGMTDLEKMLALHDYLVLNCAYNWNVGNGGSASSDSLVYTAYGAIIDGDAVCQGYAEAYQLLLQRVGIDVGVVSCNAMNHAWNWVELDGKYYHVDVTWDDPLYTPDGSYTKSDYPGQCTHKYFLVDDTNLEGHYSYDMHCTDGKYASGYLFSKNSSAIYYYDGMYYYSDSSGNICSSNSLRNSNSSQGNTTATAHYNNAIYYTYMWNNRSNVYRYDLQTGAKMNIYSGSSGWYGFETAEDGALWLVRLNGTASPDRVQNLAQPAGGITPGSIISSNTELEPTAQNPAGMMAVHNYGRETKEITVCAAVYNAANRQIGVSTVTVQAAPGGNLVTINGGRHPNAVMAKIFLIDSDGRPVCQEVKLN